MKSRNYVTFFGVMATHSRSWVFSGCQDRVLGIPGPGFRRGPRAVDRQPDRQRRRATLLFLELPLPLHSFHCLFFTAFLTSPLPFSLRFLDLFTDLSLPLQVPIVHSVSYGWQGNLTQINVKDADVAIIDGNLVKMAAKGISVMISSGDSGSGYAAPNMCEKPGAKGVGISGTVLSSMEAQEMQQCCEVSHRLMPCVFRQLLPCRYNFPQQLPWQLTQRRSLRLSPGGLPAQGCRLELRAAHQAGHALPGGRPPLAAGLRLDRVRPEERLLLFQGRRLPRHAGGPVRHGPARGLPVRHRLRRVLPPPSWQAETAPLSCVSHCLRER